MTILPKKNQPPHKFSILRIFIDTLCQERRLSYIKKHLVTLITKKGHFGLPVAPCYFYIILCTFSLIFRLHITYYFLKSKSVQEPVSLLFPPPGHQPPYDFLERLQGPKNTADFSKLYSCTFSAQGLEKIWNIIKITEKN